LTTRPKAKSIKSMNKEGRKNPSGGASMGEIAPENLGPFQVSNHGVSPWGGWRIMTTWGGFGTK